MRITGLMFLCLAIPGPVAAGPMTLPIDERPAWLERDGIVMAGSWEPLLFRVRRDGAAGYTPTAEQRAAYEREHSPEMIAKLKDLGVNFVMMHCHKGGGLVAERESMADAVRFSKRCHDAGLRVGVYNYSGAFLWELLFKEVPQAKDWVLLDRKGNPLTYGRATYRYRWNRSHPDAQAYYRKIVRFAVQDIRADLIHFDNYGYGPGRDAHSVKRFRDHLRKRFAPAQLAEMGVEDVAAVMPPMDPKGTDMLRRVWLAFCCASLAESYHDMSRFARTLRKDVLVECNPGGAGGKIRPPVDHGRLLQGGEAYWAEGGRPGVGRIINYKIARRMDNVCFVYTRTPLEMAESMAFNRDCLGCVCWFEYDKLVNYPGRKEPVSAKLAPFIRFFHNRRDLLRRADVVADVAVLRSFPSQVHGGSAGSLTHGVERMLVENRICYQTIFDHHVTDLKRYRVLVLAGCVALSDLQIGQIQAYVKSGGRLCLVGPAATHDEWMRPRGKAALEALPSDRVFRCDGLDGALDTIRQACGDEISLSVEVVSRPWTTAVGGKLYLDRDYAITRLPEALAGLKTVRFSHTQAKRDATLRFRAKVPVRVFAVFGPERKTDQWLDPQPGWQVHKASAFGCTLGYIDKGDVYYRDFDAGPVTLFQGKRGNYAILGIKAQSPDGDPVPFVADGRTGCGALRTELTEQAGRRLVHLVNYRPDQPIKDITVHLRLPTGRRAKTVSLASPERPDDVRAPFKEKGVVVTFTVPSVDVYTIAAVRVD